MSRKPAKASKFPVWERAYKGHVLWLGKKKLGKVTVVGDGRYTWSAAGRGGSANDLAKARKAVEAAVAMADKQLDLFG